MSKPTPAQLVCAHQYLYYVLACPVITDYDYDLYCRDHGIEGGGGSDCARDYDAETIALAEDLRAGRAECI